MPAQLTVGASRNGARGPSSSDERAKSGPLTWRWPVSPKTFNVYDKYRDVEVTLSADAASWRLSVQGRTEEFRFADAADGRLQRKLVMLTQAGRSPSSISKFTRSLTRKWTLYVDLLAQDPLTLKQTWNTSVNDVDTAKAGKTILTLACVASVGPWRRKHLPLIKALSTRDRVTRLAHRGRVKRRDSVLGVDVQAALVTVLDESAVQSDLTPDDCEGLVALAIALQHGVRPVQLLALRVEHLCFYLDAANEPACVISFHAAKQQDGQDFELCRQVKPEWTPIVQQLHSLARQAGRTRLFSCETADALWLRVKATCARRGVRISFTANFLRHTSAQTLADAGHSRASIQAFLGHSRPNAANAYVRASRQQTELINVALGTSRLYKNILSIAAGKFASMDEMQLAGEDQQVGGIVGDRMVAGIGLCRTGQPSCRYNPVTSCYGCSKFIPALDRAAHEEAIAGMREEVRLHIGESKSPTGLAYLQLTRALAGAQQALDTVKLSQSGAK